MNYDDLNNDEIKEIINRLKYPKKKFALSAVSSEVSKMFGKIDIDEVILDDDSVKYILHIFRGKRNINRFSIHLRFKDNNEHVVRLDINPSNRHTNPDGTIVKGSHIHIYNNEYPRRDAIAIPLEQSDFPNVDTIIDAVGNFIDYTNIKENNDGKS